MTKSIGKMSTRELAEEKNHLGKLLKKGKLNEAKRIRYEHINTLYDGTREGQDELFTQLSMAKENKDKKAAQHITSLIIRGENRVGGEKSGMEMSYGLALYPYAPVRKEAVRHISDPHVIDFLVKDKSVGVRKVLARKATLSNFAQAVLAEDENAKVREAISSNPYVVSLSS